MDDVDHLFLLSSSIETSKVINWIFAAHNEHVLPLLKILYFAFYKLFWINPLAFHLIIIAVCTSLLYFIYSLVLKFTNSPLASMISITIIASTNLLDLSIFVITNSHIFFCVLSLIILFYAQIRYSEEKNNFWLAVVFFSALLAPLSFSLGVLSFPFAFLFDRFYICKKYSKNYKSAIFIVLVAWLLSLTPYIYNIDTILHTAHYKDLNKATAFQIMNIPGAIFFLITYLSTVLIPHLLFNRLLSAALFVFVTFVAITQRKKIDWRLIVLILIFGMLPNLIIFTFRIAWGKYYLYHSRYNVFPVISISIVYSLILSSFLKGKGSIILNKKFYSVLCLLLFLLTSYSSSTRFYHARKISLETNYPIQEFSIQYKAFFKDYFAKNKTSSPIKIKDTMLYPPRLDSLSTKWQPAHCITRYPRYFSFFSQYILPKNIKDKIIWGNQTERSVLDFLNDPRNKNSYKMIRDFIS